jgi:hypothetical protein
MNSAVDRSLCAPENTIPVQAARTVGTVAAYFRQNDLQDMVQDVQRYVRRNPERFLIAAASMGFVLGTALRRRNSE